MGFFKGWFKPNMPSVSVTESSDPLDRRRYDSPVGNQEEDGNGADNDCSSYAVAGALSQMLTMRAGKRIVVAPNDVWRLQRGMQNLTAALNACGRLPGTHVGGVQASDGKVYSIESYTRFDLTALAERSAEAVLRHEFEDSRAVVLELKTCGDLDGGYKYVNARDFGNGSHAVCVSAIEDKCVVIKNSFGSGFGDGHGYQYIVFDQLPELLVAAYAINEIKEVAP